MLDAEGSCTQSPGGNCTKDASRQRSLRSLFKSNQGEAQCYEPRNLRVPLAVWQRGIGRIPPSAMPCLLAATRPRCFAALAPRRGTLSSQDPMETLNPKRAGPRPSVRESKLLQVRLAPECDTAPAAPPTSCAISQLLQQGEHRSSLGLVRPTASSEGSARERTCCVRS